MVAVVCVLAAVAFLAERKVDLATLRSLSITWRWILASIAFNVSSALLKASVWDSVQRGMPYPLKLPFRAAEQTPPSIRLRLTASSPLPLLEHHGERPAEG